MGVASAAQIAEALQAGGLASDTPAAIIQHASLPQQRHALTTLQAMAHTMETQQLGSPSILVIGDVLHGVASVQQTSYAETGSMYATSHVDFESCRAC